MLTGFFALHLSLGPDVLAGAAGVGMEPTHNPEPGPVMFARVTVFPVPGGTGSESFLAGEL